MSLDLNSFDKIKIRHSYGFSKINQRFVYLTNGQFHVVLVTPLNKALNLMSEVDVIVVSYLSCQYKQYNLS